jgi:DNA-binding IscR family transcriptional regulator
MKLSTRVQYGTRALLELGLHCGEGPSIEPYNFKEKEKP